MWSTSLLTPLTPTDDVMEISPLYCDIKVGMVAWADKPSSCYRTTTPIKMNLAQVMFQDHVL